MDSFKGLIEDPTIKNFLNHFPSKEWKDVIQRTLKYGIHSMNTLESLSLMDHSPCKRINFTENDVTEESFSDENIQNMKFQDTTPSFSTEAKKPSRVLKNKAPKKKYFSRDIETRRSSSKPKDSLLDLYLESCLNPQGKSSKLSKPRQSSSRPQKIPINFQKIQKIDKQATLKPSKFYPSDLQPSHKPKTFQRPSIARHPSGQDNKSTARQQLKDAYSGETTKLKRTKSSKAKKAQQSETFLYITSSSGESLS